LTALWMPACSRGKCSCARKLPSLDYVVWSLFSKVADSDEQLLSSFYQAAVNEHCQMAETCVALLIISQLSYQSKRARSVVAHDNHWTMEEWLHVFGFPSFFTKQDFELCVRKASIEGSVKSMLTRNKYSLLQLVEDICLAHRPAVQLLSVHKIHFILKRTVVAKKKKTVACKHRRPALVVEDDECVSEIFDASQGEETGLCEDETYFHDEESFVDELGEAELVNSIVERYDAMALGEDEESVWSGPDETEGQIAGKTIEDFSIDNDQDDEGDDDEEWSCLSSPDESWEIMSEVGSVISMADDFSSVTTQCKKMSYSDMAKQGNSKGFKQSSTPKSNLRQKPTVTSKPQTISEDEPFFEETPFDSFFVMEGAKQGRGGKRRSMFKGNSRTSKR